MRAFFSRLLMVLLFTSIVSSAMHAQDADLRIVATTTQASDLARSLTADVPGVTVTGLMGAGVDPHLYKPTEADIRAIESADLLIYSGLLLEGGFNDVFAALAARGVATLALGNALKPLGYIVPSLEDDEAAADDPHFWFDPRNWAEVTAILSEKLADRDPANAAAYRANAAAYIAQLEALYAWGEAAMQSVPADRRLLITSHDAFQYFSTAFGWRVGAVQGISTQTEAGVGDIQVTVDQVISERVPVLFIESSVPPRTIEAVREAVRAAGGDVRIGMRDLFSDAMGAPADFGGTYIGMIAHNIYTILQSYDCAGIAVTLPPWDEAAIGLALPDEFLTVEC